LGGRQKSSPVTNVTKTSAKQAKTVQAKREELVAILRLAKGFGLISTR
jgi:hypothetical protein